jgi:type II secretory pathway component PulC
VATVEDKGKRENLVVGIGDMISGAQVVGIERRRIVLDNRGKREQLSLDDSETTPSPAPRASTRRTAPRARVRRPPAARPTPPARPPAPAEALGALFSGGDLQLGEGERLTAVNGLSVADPANIPQVMELLSEGGPMTLSLTSPDGSVRQVVQEAP